MKIKSLSTAQENIFDSTQNPFGCDNSPIEHLDAIEKFAKNMVDKYKSEIINPELSSVGRPEMISISSFVVLKVRTLRKALKENDLDRQVMAGLNLAYAFWALGKQEALHQKRQARIAGHRENINSKREWINQALSELQEMVNQKAENRPNYKHTEYLNELYKKKKYRDAKRAWKEQMRIEFIAALRSPRALNRPNLVRGLKHI